MSNTIVVGERQSGIWVQEFKGFIEKQSMMLA